MALRFKYLIRKRALGDVLWIEPAIAELAKEVSKLIVHTRYNQLFENYPAKNVVFKNKLSILEKIFIRLSITIPFISKSVLNLDNAYEVSPNQHFLHAYQQKAGLPIKDLYPQLFLTEKEKHQYASAKEKAPYVVIHKENGALKNYRKVFGVDWEKLVAHCNNSGFSVYQIGGSESVISGATFIQTNLRDLMALLYNASYFMGVDSGPSHIAAALKIPSILFFGRVNPDFRHFRKLFNGFILHQPCCFDESGHNLVISEEINCKIVGENGIPPCCKFKTEKVIACFDQLKIKK